MQAVVVEPGDVLDDGQLELRAGAPRAVGDLLGRLVIYLPEYRFEIHRSIC